MQQQFDKQRSDALETTAFGAGPRSRPVRAGTKPSCRTTHEITHLIEVRATAGCVTNVTSPTPSEGPARNAQHELRWRLCTVWRCSRTRNYAHGSVGSLSVVPVQGGLHRFWSRLQLASVTPLSCQSLAVGARAISPAHQTYKHDKGRIVWSPS